MFTFSILLWLNLKYDAYVDSIPLSKYVQCAFYNSSWFIHVANVCMHVINPLTSLLAEHI